MKTKLNNLLQAINLASYDGVDSLEVSLNDLLLLRETILNQEERLKKEERDKHILNSKLALKDLERPLKLKTYLEMQR